MRPQSSHLNAAGEYFKPYVVLAAEDARIAKSDLHVDDPTSSFACCALVHAIAASPDWMVKTWSQYSLPHLLPS